ncbi:MAG TPA: amino acid adenylation domain-containing protein, partial [Candidatus Deferrimicrobium sp.]|nr:amino acid adenylation domain-containing protein [Candidatus Deferrimicrobium sp.]
MDLTERIARLSPEQRKIFELKLKQQNIDISPMRAAKISAAHGLWTLKPAEKKEYYSLSTSQKRLYILNLFMDYSIKLIFQVNGNLDRSRMQEALKKLIKRHECLRTSFEKRNEEPVQRIHDNVEFEIEYYESGIRPEAINFFRPFDFSQAPLLRVALIKLGVDRYQLVIFMHHLVLDGVSMRILSREFIQLYLGEEEKLQAPGARYRDFVEWQNQLPETEAYKRQEAYWLEVFSDEIPVLNMPTDYPRPVIQSFAGKKIRFEIKKEMLAALRNLALSNDVTTYMILLAVYNTLLSRYSGQEDIVIGTISAGRHLREIQNMVGVFINPLALRNFPLKDQTFTAFLGELKQNILEAFKNQLYPFGELLEKILKKKDFSRNPLFDAMIVFQNVDPGNRGIGGLRFELASPGEEGDETHAQQDLCLWVEEEEGRILIDLEYCPVLFKKETMERFTGHFLTILQGAAENPGLKLGKIKMISDQEKQQILEEFNNSDTVFPIVHQLHYLFEQQAERIPDHIAVAGIRNRVGDMKTITYKELNRISTCLAAVLQRKGVKPDIIVGVMLDRSIELIGAVIGILKAGGAYLPIDPSYPPERIDYILKDSNAKILINKSEKKINVKNKNFEDLLVLNFENLNFNSLIECPHRGLSNFNSSNLAYIIYTSGSTGIPKGVMVEHGNIVNAAFAWLKEYRLAGMEVILLQVAHCFFDVFMGDFARAFSAGGKMIICPEEFKMDLPAFYSLIRMQQVTLFEATPSLIIPFMEYVFEEKLATGHLRLLIVGSDSVRVEDFKNLLSHFGTRMRIINSYGATEAAVDTSYYEESLEKLVLPGNVPIGKPMPNMKFFILDSHGEVQPVGIPGELYIGGRGVVRGYLNNPGLTAEKFNQYLWDNKSFYRGSRGAVFSKITPLVLYKTGDMARWLSDGNVEFLGRMDYQVKIRGFRIELEEIEHRLASHKDIKEVIVLAKEDKNGDKSLCAYIVPADGAGNVFFTVSDLRAYLFGLLPDYMIPSHFI